MKEKLIQRRHPRRSALLVLVLISIILAQVPIAAQVRPPTGKKRTTPPVTTKKVQPQDTPRGPATALIPTRKAEKMSQAMAEGKLPEPLRMPVGDVDARARELARLISAGDANSTSALYAAILAAGFGVRDPDGSVIQTTDRGQGILFDAWEIAAIARLYGQGYGVTLKHLSDSFAQNIPDLRGAPLANMFLDGIRSGAASDHPSVRFWARTIVELGKHSSHSYDILANADPGVRLDALQTALMLKRMAGDLALLGRDERQANSKGPSLRNVVWQPVGFSEFSLLGDDYDQFSGPRRLPRLAGIRAPKPTAETPCSQSDITGLILDYNALGITTGFGALLDYLSPKVPGAEKLGKGIGYANVVLTVIKFIVSYALLTTDLTIDTHPLERTKNTQPGKTATLTAKIQIDPTKWDILNCIRPALNAMGLDFDLPGNGPLTDVRVEWRLVLGGDSRGWLGTAQDLGKLMAGEPVLSDKIVYLDAVAGTDRSPVNQFTDANGISKMNVVGVPQGRDLSKEKLKKVDKVAGVRVDIQLKSMKISDPVKAASTFGDMAGNIISFLTKDIVGGIVGTAAETLYRSNWKQSEPLFFLVYDWEPCEAWEGTVSIKTELYKRNERTTSGIFESDEKKHEFEATFNLSSTKDTTESFTNGYYADGVMRYEEIVTQVHKNPYGGGFCDTGQRTAKGSRITVNVHGTITTINTIENVGAGTGRGTIYISPRGAEGVNVLLKPPPPFSGVYRHTFQYQAPHCRAWEQANSFGPEETPRTFGVPAFEFLATFDPSGALVGSKTIKQGDGTVTYKWNLQKCK